ncbi:MAG: GTPase HflX [bacterium]|nr:GTPase HflX [bacterium]
MSRSPEPTGSRKERVIVCGVHFPDSPAEFEGELSEIRALVAAAEAEVVGEGITQSRRTPHPATMMGKGKVEEVHEAVQVHSPDAVVVDNDLSPAQIRNLEKAWDKRIIDRSELILDIFSRRARTRQARLQVELAQNEYLLPRLRRMWTHLERMEGAIGTRGPGETQLETDRRLLNKRVTDLKRELAEIEKRKQREVHSRGSEFTVGLVGYTNAGKSTLLNLLTDSDELVADMPFATLDTRTRRWILPDRRSVLLSDTVGFLQRLPHHLVASFHATLEQTIEADLLLHVVDASHPDAAIQMQAVEEVLSGLSQAPREQILVFNKVDRVADSISLHLLLEDSQAEIVYVSAKTGEGIDRLTRAVTARLDQRASLVEVHVPVTDGKTNSLVKSFGATIEESCPDGTTMVYRARLGDGALGHLRRAASADVRIEILEAPEARASIEVPVEPAPDDAAAATSVESADDPPQELDSDGELRRTTI